MAAWVAILVAAALLGGCAPDGPDLLLKGRRMLDQGNAAGAVQPLYQAVHLMRTNGLAWSYLGMAYHQTGQTTNAVMCYEQALRWDRDLVDVHYNLGLAYLEADRPGAARPELVAYTVQRPKSLPGWLARGAAELRAHEGAAAMSSYSSALRIEAANPTALNGLGMALVQRGRYREAAGYFAAAVQQKPDFAGALRNLATVQQQHLKDVPAAVQTWRQYAALQPPPPDVEAVNALLLQLQPPAPPPPPPVVTNTVPVVVPPATNIVRPTPPPRTLPTNAPVVTRIPPTNPPPVRPVPPTNTVAARTLPATNPPAPRLPVATPPPAPPRTNPPLEVVHVPENPPIAPPPSATPPASNPPPILPREPVPAPPTNVVVTPAVTSAPPTAVSTPKFATVPTNIVSEDKPGFFARLNPLNLFKKKPKEELRTTRLPPPSTNARPVAVTPPPGTVPVTNPPLPGPATNLQTEPPDDSASARPRPATPRITPLPSPPRYAYTRPSKPAAGNRPEADRAFRAGVQAQQAGEFQSALDSYQRATTSDPQFFEAWNNLGLAAHDLAKPDVALPALEAALSIRPDSSEARYNFAVALRDAGYALDAATEFQQALVTSPSDVRTHVALGNLYAQRLKDTTKARACYRRALDLDPNHPQAPAIRAWLKANPG